VIITNNFLFVEHSGKERNYTDEDRSSTISRFYGPATGCLELGKLGYTLNGLYLVNGEGLQPSSNRQNNQIEVVECRFHQKMQHGSKQSNKYSRNTLKIDQCRTIYNGNYEKQFCTI